MPPLLFTAKHALSTDGGIDTGPHNDGIGGGYLFCDGDNRADDGTGKPRPPILYTIQQIAAAAAAPIAYVVVTATQPPAPPPPPPVDWHAKYEALVSALAGMLKTV